MQDQGGGFDGNGNLRNWWTDADRSRVDAKRRNLVAQYDAFSPLPGYHVNGALTLGENAADNAGLSIEIRAYRPARQGARCGRVERLKVDPHSPGQFRANGTLRNQNAFDEVFGVKPGDAMYLPPEQRISLWQTDREVVCPEKAR